MELDLHSFLLLFFFLKHLYWSIIALQCCVSFGFISKWISYTYVPILLLIFMWNWFLLIFRRRWLSSDNIFNFIELTLLWFLCSVKNIKVFFLKFPVFFPFLLYFYLNLLFPHPYCLWPAKFDSTPTIFFLSVGSYSEKEKRLSVSRFHRG